LFGTCVGFLLVDKCKGTPCGFPEVGYADGEGRHEACPYAFVVDLHKVKGGWLAAPGSAFTLRNAGWGKPGIS